MKRKLISIGILLVGLGILAYPHLSTYLNDKNGSYISEDYQKQVAAADEEELQQIRKQAEIYNDNLTGTPVHDPFVKGSGVAMPTNYFQVLNYKKTMAVISIPKINVELPVYHGTSESVLKSAVGHLEGSTLPIGGENRHAVLTGHTGLSNAKIFTNLTEMQKGDQFYVKVLGETMAYEVFETLVVDPKETDKLKVVEGKDLVTLLTCTPYGVNSHRLLVRGQRVPYEPKAVVASEPLRGLTKEQKQLLLIGGVTGGIMVAINWWIWRRNRQKRSIPCKKGGAVHE